VSDEPEIKDYVPIHVAKPDIEFKPVEDRKEEQFFFEEEPEVKQSTETLVSAGSETEEVLFPLTEEKPVQLNLFQEKMLDVSNKEEYRILGQIFDTYWLVTFLDKLFIIDQHAAHEKVKYETLMKQYKEKHPQRYQQILEAKGCWEIAQSENGIAYFIAKAPYSANLAIKVEDGKGYIISLLEILEEMQVAENAPRVPLPDTWKQLSDKAINTYNQYFVRINNSRADDKKTKAKDVIVNKLNKLPNLSDNTKKLLLNTRRLVDRGSFDLIKKLLLIDEELTNTNSLFTLTTEEIEQILENELGRLVTVVTKRQGEPSIILGTIK
jgi:DNA mismatch repair ATPase MutL